MEKVDGNVENIYRDLHSNQKILIYEMLKRGILVDIVDEKLELIRTSYSNHEEFIYDRDSSIMPYHVSVLAGNKGLAKKIMQDKGICVPIGEVFSLGDSDSLLQAFSLFDTPVVLKPVFGSHGYDVYLNLKTERDVLEAIDKMSYHLVPNTDILIEEYFEAPEYRVFVTKNRDYAVLLRDPAHVFGNGSKNIEELIECENYQRMHPRTNALCSILVDEEVYQFLDKQNLSMNTVPSFGEKVYLRGNSNVAMGGVCCDYTELVHPSVIDIGMQVLDAFPGLPYVGMDFMSNSISEQQTSDSYRIIEINTVPGLHMHFRPAIGKSRNVAEYMVDLIYPETKKEEKEYGKIYQKSM